MKRPIDTKQKRTQRDYIGLLFFRLEVFLLFGSILFSDHHAIFLLSNINLSLITDAYSRKIVGHHLSDDLRTEGVSLALRMAISGRKTRLLLIHHSDRGLQYCSTEYQQLLSAHHIQPSMTDGYDCYQNALAERINGILKDEFLLTTCDDHDQLKQVITESIQIYNTKRPHMKLNYKTPTFIHEKSLAELSTRDL